jgi:two-component system response regulator
MAPGKWTGGVAAERDVVDGYRLGVNSAITKPVDFEQFTEVVRTLGLYWVLLNQAPILTG